MRKHTSKRNTHELYGVKCESKHRGRLAAGRLPHTHDALFVARDYLVTVWMPNSADDRRAVCGVCEMDKNLAHSTLRGHSCRAPSRCVSFARSTRTTDRRHRHTPRTCRVD
jgi:hypothetical protein